MNRPNEISYPTRVARYAVGVLVIIGLSYFINNLFGFSDADVDKFEATQTAVFNKCTSAPFITHSNDNRTMQISIRNAYLPTLPAEEQNVLVIAILASHCEKQDEFSFQDTTTAGTTLDLQEKHLHVSVNELGNDAIVVLAAYKINDQSKTRDGLKGVSDVIIKTLVEIVVSFAADELHINKQIFIGVLSGYGADAGSQQVGNLIQGKELELIGLATIPVSLDTHDWLTIPAEGDEYPMAVDYRMRFLVEGSPQDQVLPTQPLTNPSATPYSTSGCQNTTLVARLVVGQDAYVLTDPPEPNILRASYGFSAERTGYIQPGERFRVLSGPICEDGANWWQVRLANGVTGWTSEGGYGYYYLGLTANSSKYPANTANVSSCPNAPPLQLAVGDTAQVDFNNNGALKLYSTANGTGQDAIRQVYDNDRLKIISGPICGASGDRWMWYVEHIRSGDRGWTAEGIIGDYWMCPLSNVECGN